MEIKCNVDSQTAKIVSEKAIDWPGVGVEVVPVRDYPTGNLTSEIIGFLGPIPAESEQLYSDLGFLPNRDKIGYAGIEDQLQDILGGTNGKQVVEVDVAGKELQDLAPVVEPVPGDNVRLTIDTRLQSAARTALINEINYLNVYAGKVVASNGVVIAMNPKTGEIWH